MKGKAVISLTDQVWRILRGSRRQGLPCRGGSG